MSHGDLPIPLVKKTQKNKQQNAFVVKNVQLFTNQVLPQYFKHSKFTSFVRHLNMYQFRKLRTTDVLSFQHEYLQKDNYDALFNIMRRLSQQNITQLSMEKNSFKFNKHNVNGNEIRLMMCRMSFDYNAQRILHWFTKKKPSYWDSIYSNIKIVHYSSSPKPWNLTNMERTVDKVERIWHKYYLSLQNRLQNQNFNKNYSNRILILPSLNEILSNDNDNDEQKQIDNNENTSKIEFWKQMSKNVFGSLITKRPMEIGRVCNNKENAKEFETKFYNECQTRFYYFQVYLGSLLKKYEQNDYKQLLAKSPCILGKIPKIIHQIWIGDKVWSHIRFTLFWECFIYVGDV